MAAVGPRKHGAASLGGHQRQLALDASGVGRSRAGVGCCAQTGETVHGRALDLGRRRDRAGAGTTAPNRWGGASDKAGVRVGLAFLAFLASCLSAANGPLCSRSLRFKSPCGLRLPLLKRCCPSSSRAWCWHCAHARAMQAVFWRRPLVFADVVCTYYVSFVSRHILLGRPLRSEGDASRSL